MEDKIILSPKILELNSSNDIYMTLKMIILTTNVNLNGAKFTEDFIDGIIENQETYRGIGLVVNRTKLENEVFDSLGHEFDGSCLNTDMIGSFVAFEKQENDDGSYSLIGESRVLKRFPKTCDAIVQLCDQDKLRFSCEALVGEYGSVEEGVREIPYATGKNKLIGNCIVSSPAEVNAKPTLLVASLEEDLSLENNQADNINSPNGGGSVFKFTLEMNADGSTLSYAEMRKQMNAHLRKIGKHMSLKKQMMDLNEMDIEAYGQMADVMLAMMPEDAKYFDLWTPEDGMFDGYCVCSDWYNGMMFMMDWSVNGEEIEMSNPRKAKIQYVEVSEIVVNSLVKKLGDFNKTNEELSSQLELKSQELETKITEINTLIEQKSTLETKVEELSQTKTEEEVKDETILKLNNQLNELNGKIEQMQPLIDEYNQIQEEKRITELNNKKEALKTVALNSKVISAEDLETEEFKQYIEELNEDAINKVIVNRICELNSKVVEEEPKPKTDDVVIATAESKDLLPETLESKYGLNL